MMSKEELEKEAKERAEKLEESQTLGVYDNDEDFEYDRGWNKGEVAGFEEGYLTGAEPREKQIAELQAQIEKMKCCSNCDYNFSDGNCYFDKQCPNLIHWKLRG